MSGRWPSLGPGERQTLAGPLVLRGVDGYAQAGRDRTGQLGPGEGQLSCDGMPEPERTVGRLGHLVPGPELGELRADVAEAADVLFPRRVADVPAVSGAEPRDEMGDLLVVVEEPLARTRLGD